MSHPTTSEVRLTVLLSAPINLDDLVDIVQSVFSGEYVAKVTAVASIDGNKVTVKGRNPAPADETDWAEVERQEREALDAGMPEWTL